MKKIVTYFITGVIVSASLVGCGGSGSSKASMPSEESYAYNEPAYEEAAYASDDMYYGNEYDTTEEYDNGSAKVAEVQDETVSNSNRKIIKNVNISAETEEFDRFIANVNAKVSALGGYLESSNINGRSINSSKGSLRSASLTARIPSKNLDSFVDNVSENSNITNKSESAEDVTLSYADTEAHIKSLRTEQERLDQLLLQADDIETIIAIEQRITDVRYELESYESRLRTIDNQVDYSTVYIDVREVERYTPVEEPKQTVAQRIAIGFTENLISAKEYVVDFFVGVIVALPILFVLLLFVAIPVVIVFFIVRFIVEKAKGPEYKAEKKAKKAAKIEARKLKKTNKSSTNTKADDSQNEQVK